MSIRRYYVPDAIVFITQVVHGRQPIFQHEQHIALLRSVLHHVKKHHPFHMIAYVFLPEHFHLLLRPLDDATFSDVMQSLKRNFTLDYKTMIGINGRMKFWQKGFWDHVIRDEDDFSNHLDYIHYNPVHHGLVTHPEDWPHSSYLEWKKRNAYPERWGWSMPDSVNLIDWHSAESGEPNRGE
ncbi:MAG: transposase [Caldilinea sp.]|nr:transposase [Caldilineaceae bacterium]MCO5212853.1 transposase [Caldilinea sp.]